jgi:hypothetical protein
MSPNSLPKFTVSAVILTYSLLVATFSFVNSEKHRISDYNLSKPNVQHRANDTSKLNHGSFYRLSIFSGTREYTSTEAKSKQNGLHFTFYGTNYADVRYDTDTEASKASALDMNSTKYEVKDGSDFREVAKTEFETTRPPLDRSPDTIIKVPRRKCPDGQKMDPSGKCKTVWKR